VSQKKRHPLSRPWHAPNRNQELQLSHPEPQRLNLRADSVEATHRRHGRSEPGWPSSLPIPSVQSQSGKASKARQRTSSPIPNNPSPNRSPTTRMACYHPSSPHPHPQSRFTQPATNPHNQPEPAHPHPRPRNPDTHPPDVYSAAGQASNPSEAAKPSINPTIPIPSSVPSIPSSSYPSSPTPHPPPHIRPLQSHNPGLHNTYPKVNRCKPSP